MKYYHVTTVDKEKSIMEKGLIPHREYSTPGVKARRPTAVFLWDSRIDAVQYCEEFVRPLEGPCLILEVELPKEIAAKPRKCVAESYGYVCEYLVRETIPPKHIKVIKRG